MMSDPALSHYIEAWPRAGDVGVIAEAKDGSPVGAAWWRLFSSADPGYGFVRPDIPEVSIGVIEARRGQGIGTHLLEALVECGRLQGLPALSLSVEVENPAVRLYTRVGWEVIARSDASLTMLLRIGRHPTHPTPAF